MRVKQLIIRNLRNISEADIDFSKTINFLQGENGAGKTAVLEALYLLARAKTFKKGDKNALIQNEKENLSLFLKGTKNTEDPISIGLVRDRNKTNIRMNGETIKTSSNLAKNFPIALITPQSHKILEEGPEYRRSLLNWGVFHVEQYFGKLISDYNRVLHQRNQALKDNAANITIWDNQLVEYAQMISIHQNNYLNGWIEYLRLFTNQCDEFKSLTVKYYQGWSNGLSMIEALQQKHQLDRRYGFTSIGPQRADFLIGVDGKPVKSYLSRGQQKKLIILIILAQSVYMESLIGELPVFLIDDFQSELDEKTQNYILSIVSEYQIQTIITGIQNLSYLKNNTDLSAHMFHVEQGMVRAISG